MEEEKKDLQAKDGIVDDILDVVEEVIPDDEGKTRVGRWLRILDKFLKLKRLLGISIGAKTNPK